MPFLACYLSPHREFGKVWTAESSAFLILSFFSFLLFLSSFQLRSFYLFAPLGMTTVPGFVIPFARLFIL